MTQPTPSAAEPLDTTADTYIRARQIAAGLNDAQISAPLMQGQQIDVTIRVHGNSQQMPGTVQLWGVATGITHAAPPHRRVLGVEFAQDARVYDGRLREVMLKLWEDHQNTYNPVRQTILAEVIGQLEKIQKLDVPMEERGGL